MADVLQTQQYGFAAHLRDPQNHPAPPGIEDRRLAVYRELFFNNILSLLSGNFPVLNKTLGEAAWTLLAREFYARHRSQTPLFAEIGREFIRFLQGRDNSAQPWLAELAHYEWVELALQISDAQAPAFNPSGSFGSGVPVLSPHAWALAYAWPVQQIGPEYQPQTAPEMPTLLLVRRDAQHEVRFAEISPLLYRLIGILGEARLTGYQALQQLASEAGSNDDPNFIAQGLEMLERLREEGTVLGTLAV